MAQRVLQRARGPQPAAAPPSRGPVLLRLADADAPAAAGLTPEALEALLASQGPGQRLPDAARRDAEQRLGADFGAVRVHADPAAARAARAVGAHAFALGEHLFFAPGQSPAPGSAASRLLLHELAHVLQARRGEVRTAPREARISQPSDALERSAEATAQAAARRVPALAPEPAGAAARAPTRAAVLRQPTEPVVMEANGFTLEQFPSKGEATLRRDGQLLAYLVWEPRAGRQIDKVGFTVGTSGVAGLGTVTSLDFSLVADFAIDITIDTGAEQSLADAGNAPALDFTHHIDAPGVLHLRQPDGSTRDTGGPARFGLRYTALRGERAVPGLPPVAIPAGPDPLAPAPVPPAAPLPKVWSFKDADSYDHFAASHSNTKWAEIQTSDGHYVAWALTIEAATRMAEKVRAGREDFEFLSNYPGGKVIAVHLQGRKLPALADLGDLYYRSLDDALAGAQGALPECEIFNMEGGRFKRQALSHSHALVRWKQIEDRDAHPLIALVPDDPQLQTRVIAVPNDFVALRVQGDHGLQTIYPQSLKDADRRTELKGDFSSYDPLGDDLDNALPDDLSYDALVRTARTLLRRKRELVAGKESPEEADGLSARLDAVRDQLRKLGVNLDEGHLIDALDAGRDLRRIDGRVLVSPAPPNFFNQRLRFSLAFDYLPPTAHVKPGWHWQANGVDAQFLQAQAPQGGNEVVLDDLFWNFVPDAIEKANGLEALADIYIDGADKPTVTLRSGWVPFSAGRDLPATITIDGETTVVTGATKVYRLAEWVPGKDYSVDWVTNGSVKATMPVFTTTFTGSGSARVYARIYRLGDGWPRSREFVREITLDVEVQDQQTAGQAMVDRIKQQGQPSLAGVRSSMDSSIDEMQKHVDAGGGQQDFWKNRLDQQKKRRDKLAELGPDPAQAKELPADPTALDDAMTYSGPVAASLVLPEAGGAQPLAIYLSVHKEGGQWKARLLDMTSADVWKFDGAGDTPLAAYQDAFGTWKSNNPYPRSGRVVHDFHPPGWSAGNTFDTWRVGKVVKDWVDGILTVGGLVVAGLLLAAPEATVTKALGVLLLTASIARGTVQIADNLSLGMSPLDSRNVVEAAGIVIAFTGLAGTALRTVGVSAVRPLVYRVGTWTVMASIAGDAGTLVYASANAIAQLQVISADPTLSDDQKSLETLRVMAGLVAQGALFIVANKDMFRGGLKKSDFFATDPKATAQGVQALPGDDKVQLDTGSRLDVAAELRKAGEAPARLQPAAVSDAALVQRYAALPWLRQSLSATEVAQVLNRLETAALKAFSDVAANKVKSAMDAIGNDAVVNDFASSLSGARLTNLVEQTAGKTVADLHAAFGAAGTAALLDGVGDASVVRLLKPPGGLAAAGLKTLADEVGLPALKNLAADRTGPPLTGAALERMVKQHGADRCKWAASELEGPQVQALFAALDDAAIDKLSDQRPTQVRDLLVDLGAARLKAASGHLTGQQLQSLREGFGNKGLITVLDEYSATGTGDPARLPGFATNMAAGPKAAPVLGSGGADSLVVDSNTYIALKKLLQGSAWKDLGTNEQAIVNAVRVHNGVAELTTDPPARDLVSILGKPVDLRVGTATAAENAPVPGLATQGIPLGATRDSAAYGEVLDALSASTPKVGGNKGAIDRLEVADAFFARTSGATPTLVTSDGKVIKGLADLSADVRARVAAKARDPRAANKIGVVPFVAENFPSGFKVSITDRAGTVHELQVIAR